MTRLDPSRHAPQEVDEYTAAQTSKLRAALEQLRAVINAAAPGPFTRRLSGHRNAAPAISVKWSTPSLRTGPRRLHTRGALPVRLTGHMPELSTIQDTYAVSWSRASPFGIRYPTRGTVMM